MLNTRLSLRSIPRLVAVTAVLAGAMTASHAGSVAAGWGSPLARGHAAYSAGGPVGQMTVRHGGGYGGGHGGYYRGGGGGWGWGVGLGLGAGLLLASPWYYPGYVVAPPTTVIVEQLPQAAGMPPTQQPGRPEPVIYPRNGQSPQQLEADRQECNRWATTQQAALTDSSVFMRAIDACMDARGYTSK
jgi:hypothetical protein